MWEGGHSQTVVGVVNSVLSEITNVQFSQVGIVHGNCNWQSAMTITMCNVR